MQQEQKESLIGKILKALIVQFGAELVEKVFGEHKAATDKSEAPCPQGYVKNSKGECVPDVG